ncbi:MFS transporter, partial [bacterium]|nr:MFS transporter [bacterium]
MKTETETPIVMIAKVGRDSVEPSAMKTRMFSGDGSTESRPIGGRIWFGHVYCVVVICFVMGCSPEANYVHDHSEPGGHDHEHVAPHGGAAVVLGKELYHLEFVLDDKASSLDCYILDGHMEQFLRIAAAEIELELEGGEQVKLLPVASRATGEAVGDTSHYLNILHAGWPGGLIVGGLLSMLMVGKVRWEIQMGMFLVPAVLYGVMLWGQKFPRDEAGAAGVKYTDMLKELGLLGASVICVLLALFFKNDLGLSTTVATVLGVALLAIFGFFTKFTMGPILMAFLLVIHALVGYVELGTDSWISNITGNILASPGKGLALFVYTSALMFTLRFFAGPIVHRISPLGLLLSSAVFGALGLQLLGTFNTGMAIVFAATIYGIGKTFFWPTMLAVVSEQFPKGGAITMGSIGCVGMLSAGLLGSTGIGYKQDRFAAEHLQAASPAAYEAVKSENSNAFLIFKPIQGLDGAKVGEIKAKPAAEQTDNDKLVLAASLDGARSALKMTALIPVTMGVCYLLLIFYFKSRGGYKAVEI